jgi:penicillin-binding protein 2
MTLQGMIMKRFFLICLSLFIFSAIFLTGAAAQTSAQKKSAAKKKAAKKTTAKKTTAKKSTAVATKSTARKTTARKTTATTTRRAPAKKAPARRAPVRQRTYSPWDTPSFADSTWGDVVDGEDLLVRRAAVAALGPFNGTVVVAEPDTGKILTIVNQKLALSGAYYPCSTIKIVAGLAGLAEGIIERETRLRLTASQTMDLTEAMARSNNPYFANIGEKLGFERIHYYSKLMGLGERAGLNIEGESPGVFPDAPVKGVSLGRMTSFGTSIGLTALQLTSVVSAVANGGTLYWLQYPRNQEEAQNFVPRVKRYLSLQSAIPEVTPGMRGATEIGSARRAFYDANEPIMGKTGTCTDTRTHLGWFGSFNEVDGRRLAVVVLLTRGRHVNGPVASGVAGQVYKNLSKQSYFARDRRITPSADAFAEASLN